jgi:hypothetical protein
MPSKARLTEQMPTSANRTDGRDIIFKTYWTMKIFRDLRLEFHDFDDGKIREMTQKNVEIYKKNIIRLTLIPNSFPHSAFLIHTYVFHCIGSSTYYVVDICVTISVVNHSLQICK